MQRIIFSIMLIAMTGGALTFGATRAFFSDVETSTANVFTAGAIDLKVDNESYYNGLLNATTSWAVRDLTVEKFFNFPDLKPDDYGEDTISLHVDTNDAYLCANVKLTSNADNTQTEPEALVDTNGLATGELAKLTNFLWWADDGDNVLEDNERVISQGPIGDLSLNQSYYLTLADSGKNVWNPNTTGGPVPGSSTLYLAKAWCFGTLGTQPIAQDGGDQGRSPSGNNNGNQTSGEPEDGGITCDGTLLGNESQTDSLTADVVFEAVQARHNAGFLCTKNCTIVEEEQFVIANSSFELPEVTASSQWDVFSSPVQGWTIEWRSGTPLTYGNQTLPIPAKLEIHENVLGAAYDGDQYSELDSDWGGPTSSGTGEPASITMYQDIPTVPGKTYRIKFAFAARPNTPASENRLEVQWGGNVVHDTGNVGDPNVGIEWIPVTLDVVATSTVTRLQFTDMGTANSLGTFVDGIKLYTPVCQ